MEKPLRIKNKKELLRLKKSLRLQRRFRDCHDRITLLVRGLERNVVWIGDNSTIQIDEIY